MTIFMEFKYEACFDLPLVNCPHTTGFVTYKLGTLKTTVHISPGPLELGSWVVTFKIIRIPLVKSILDGFY